MSRDLTLIDLGYNVQDRSPAQVTNRPTLQRNQQNADHLQERDEISVFINLITRLHLENVQVTQLVGLAAVLPTLLI